MQQELPNKRHISVIGIDGSGFENLNRKSLSAITSAQAIACPKRLFDSLKKILANENINIVSINYCNTDKPRELINWLKECKTNSVVLASGDPLWYGIGKTILEYFPKDQITFYPNLSSIQLAFAHLKRPWNKASWISLHGRDPQILIEKLKSRPSELAILIDPNRGGGSEVRDILIGLDLYKNYELWILEQLGSKQEKIFQASEKDNLNNLHPLHIVVLLAKKTKTSLTKPLPFIGIPDDIFLTNEELPGLMTKREIRIQLLSDLELPDKGVIWDIGAGVGSIGLEAIRLRPKVKLLAIEKRYGSSEIIQRNSEILKVKPNLIIEDDAVKILEQDSIPNELKVPNRVVIGGGGSKRLIILKMILTRLSSGGIIVIPLATLEGVNEIRLYLKSINLSSKISQHQIWRGVPLVKETRLAPLNPVFIITIRQ